MPENKLGQRSYTTPWDTIAGGRDMEDGAMLDDRPMVTAADLARGVTRLFADLGIVAVTELSLANGRRVDVMGLARDGAVHVVEIKSCRTDFLTDGKWPDYLTFADFFYFGVADSFPRALLPESEGLILADRFGGEVVRAACHRPLPAARRKAVTLRFARAAAGRLMLPVLDTGTPLLAQLE